MSNFLLRVPSPIKQTFKPIGFNIPNWNTEPYVEKEHERKINFDDIKSRQEWAESRFKPNQRSGAGATGAFQIMPIALQDYTNKTGKTGDLNNYKFNEQVRDFMFDELYNSSFARANDATDYIRAAKALAAYNWGRGNVVKHLNKLKNKGVDIYTSLDWVDTLPKETRNYINFILRGIDGPGDLTEKAYQNALSNKKKYKVGGKMELKRVEKGKSGIHIKPENKGKFTATKKRTGKTTEELTHSKNPLTRKRAIFAQNAKKWNHKHENGGILKRVK